MYIIIVGGGKIGYYLAKTLLPNKHKIVLVEEDLETCKRIANELEITVINGDGTSIDVLEQLQTDGADSLIAVTGKDEANLIACQLAKRNFGIKRAIARVNNPKNIKVFETLGVDTAVSSTSVIAELIEREIDLSGMKTMAKIQKGNLVISEITISNSSPVCGVMLKDLKLPAKCVIISVIRGDESLIPNGFTELRANDFIFTVSTQKDQQKLKDYFIK